VNRCKSCRYPLDLPGCDGAERHDEKYPDHCRGCAVRFHDEAEYQAHLARGGKPFEAWLVDANTGRRIRRMA